jgi:hypothetical protein
MGLLSMSRPGVEGDDGSRRSSGDARAFALERADAANHVIIGEIELVQGTFYRPRAEVFSITRTSKLTTSEYLHRYVEGSVFL